VESRLVTELAPPVDGFFVLKFPDVEKTPDTHFDCEQKSREKFHHMVTCPKNHKHPERESMWPDPSVFCRHLRNLTGFKLIENGLSLLLEASSFISLVIGESTTTSISLYFALNATPLFPNPIV
jgi:hypothetical protein